MQIVFGTECKYAFLSNWRESIQTLIENEGPLNWCPVFDLKTPVFTINFYGNLTQFQSQTITITSIFFNHRYSFCNQNGYGWPFEFREFAPQRPK